MDNGNVVMPVVSGVSGHNAKPFTSTSFATAVLLPCFIYFLSFHLFSCASLWLKSEFSSMAGAVEAWSPADRPVGHEWIMGQE